MYLLLTLNRALLLFVLLLRDGYGTPTHADALGYAGLQVLLAYTCCILDWEIPVQAFEHSRKLAASHTAPIHRRTVHNASKEAEGGGLLLVRCWQMASGFSVHGMDTCWQRV